MADKQVALLVNKQELSDIRLALIKMQNEWVTNADLSESQAYIDATHSALNQVRQLTVKCSSVMKEGFNEP